MRAAEVRLIEPVPIDDDLCTGLALIEDLGFGGRLVLFAEQTCYESGDLTNVVKRKIVLPMAALGPLLALITQFLARKSGGDGLATVLRLVE